MQKFRQISTNLKITNKVQSYASNKKLNILKNNRFTLAFLAQSPAVKRLNKNKITTNIFIFDTYSTFFISSLRSGSFLNSSSILLTNQLSSSDFRLAQKKIFPF